MSIGLVLRDQDENKQGYWFDFPPIEGVEFRIRPVSYFEESRIREEIRIKLSLKELEKKELLSKKGPFPKEYEDIESNSNKENDLFILEKAVFALTGWKGVGTSPTDIATCVRENKIDLISQNKTALLFVLNVSDNIDIYLTEKLKQEKKR